MQINQLNMMTLFLRIRPNRIHFLKFILEAYEGLALLSVEKPREGLVYVRFDRDNSKEVITLLSSLCQSAKL
jgi:hypothetical protein